MSRAPKTVEPLRGFRFKSGGKEDHFGTSALQHKTVFARDSVEATIATGWDFLDAGKGGGFVFHDIEDGIQAHHLQ